MPVQLATFDITQVIVTFGVIPINGYAGDGDALTVEYPDERETITTGADGSVVVSRSASKRARVTLRLGRASPAIPLLRAAKASETRLTRVQPFRIRDLGGGVVYQAAQAWIGPPPAPSFSANAPVEEWIIECADFESVPLPVPLGG